MRASILLIVFITGTIAVQAQPQKAVADKIIAVVGDRIILQSDICDVIRDAELDGTTLSQEEQCKLIEQFMISKVLAQQAEKNSLPVTDEDVQARLDQLMYSITKGPDTEREAEAIQRMLESIRNLLKDKMLADAMLEKILANITITPSEAQAYFDKISADRLPYFESEVEIGQFLVYPEATHEMKQYVIAELRNYKRQVETKLATFEQLIQRYSQNSVSEYTLRRNDKAWDASFRAMAFRLKEGEISDPIKIINGYCIVKVKERRGNEADIQLIIRVTPVTDADISQAIAILDTVRTKIIAGKISFNQAVATYSDDDVTHYYSPFILNKDGSSYVTLDQLDKEIIMLISKMKPGEYSPPVSFTNDIGRKAVRIIYFKSRKEPHTMNMRDDYTKISQQALEEKKANVLNTWYKSKISSYHIIVDNDMQDQCEEVRKYVSAKESN